MAETLSTLSIISFVVAGVMLAIAIVLWFFFEIPMVIDDLSGRTAKKSIAKMRNENEKSGVKKYKEGKINADRGKITEPMHAIKKGSEVEENLSETGLLTDNKADKFEKEETGLLFPKNEGLSEEETVSLSDNENIKRDVLCEKRAGGKTLKIIEEVMLVSTDEVIKC